MSYRACLQCCPLAEGMEAKVLVHKHITDSQELAGLVTILAQNIRITRRITLLLLEDSDGAEEDTARSGVEIKRESSINEFLVCDMKTIKTEDVDRNVQSNFMPDNADNVEVEDENGISQAQQQKDPGIYRVFLRKSDNVLAYISQPIVKHPNDFDRYYIFSLSLLHFNDFQKNT